MAAHPESTGFAAAYSRAATGWIDAMRRFAVLATVLLSLAGGALLFHIVEKPARFWLRARIDRIWPAAAK